jgi:hypothetical protein
MRKRKVTLENWAVVRSADSLSFEELRPGARLMGNAMGYADRLGRSFVYTSIIVNVDNVNGVVETSEHSVSARPTS